MYLNYKIMQHHKHTNIQAAPDYSLATAIKLVIFWTERDFCIISDCRNSFNNKLKQTKNFFDLSKTKTLFE